MDALPDILRCDEHEPRDFRDEETVKQFVRPIRWLSINVGERRLLRLNVRLTPSKRFGCVVLHAFERAFPSIASRRPRGVFFGAPIRTAFPDPRLTLTKFRFPVHPVAVALHRPRRGRALGLRDRRPRRTQRSSRGGFRVEDLGLPELHLALHCRLCAYPTPAFEITFNSHPPARRARFFRAATAVRLGATRHLWRAEGRIPAPSRP